MKHRFSYW